MLHLSPAQDYAMLAFLVAIAISRCVAATSIDLDTFTDIECTTPSTTSPNVSIPLDACITTIGMESFHYHSTPCTGGGATTVQNYAFSDAHCIDQWDLSYGSYGSGCFGAWVAGNAFGSIMLTCKAASSNPEPDGTPVTINVGPVASDSSSGSSTAGSGGSSTSTTSNSGSSSTQTNSGSGWDSLSLGEKIGIIVALVVGIPPILIGLYMLNAERKRRQTEHNEEVGTVPHGQPQLGAGPYSAGAWGPQPARTWKPQAWPTTSTELHNMNHNGDGHGSGGRIHELAI